MSSLNYVFPENFIWGAATAGHQIEGNNTSSDWWAREHSPRTDVSEPSGDAANSYNRYREDVRLLADSGLTMYRFGIEWARIEPVEGCFSKAELLHYRAMIDACHEFGVEPMVTIYHFTMPLWFAAEGGWKRPDALDKFKRYVSYVLPILNDVTWICTINEPNMVALTQGGTEGTDFVAASLPAPDPVISKALVDAHHMSRAVIKSELPDAKVGWTIACQAFHAVPGCEKEMEEYQYPREDYFTEAGAGDDFIGVQAYLRTFIGKDGPVPVDDDVERTLTGWEYYPPALGIAVRHTWDVANIRRFSSLKTALPLLTIVVVSTIRSMPLLDCMTRWMTVLMCEATRIGPCLITMNGGRSSLHSVLSVGIKTLLNASPRHRLTGLVLFLAPES